MRNIITAVKNSRSKSNRLSDDISGSCTFVPVFFTSVIWIPSIYLELFSLHSEIATSSTPPTETALGYHLPRSSFSVTFAIYRWPSKDFIRYLKRLPSFPKCPKAQRISKNQFHSRSWAIRSFMRPTSFSQW